MNSTLEANNHKMPDQVNKLKTKKATFGMGCFWAGDALFGIIPGVISTSVGYAGGTGPSPTYKNIGDYTEVIDIEYDPHVISYAQLLNVFWNNHEYGLVRKIKSQYASLISYRDEEQKIVAEKSREHEQQQRNEIIVTEVKKFDKFCPAENYHQKHRLQMHSYLVESLDLKSYERLTSPIATKLNGYIAGVATIEQFKSDTLCHDNLDKKQYEYVEQCIIKNEGTGLSC